MNTVLQLRRTQPSIKWKPLHLIDNTIQWTRHGIAKLGEPSTVIRPETYASNQIALDHIFLGPDFSL